MPRYRKRAFVQQDQEIFEAFLSGHSAKNIAADLGLPIEAVNAARRRVHDQYAALGEKESARRRQLILVHVVIQAIMETYQRSAREPEVTTKSSQGGDTAPKVEKQLRVKAPDTRAFRVILLALEIESDLLGLVPPASAPPVPAALPAPTSPVESALHDFAKSKGFDDVSDYNEARMNHPRYAEYVRLGDEINNVKPNIIEATRTEQDATGPNAENTTAVPTQP
jgi:hypothetical protein